MCPFEKKEKLWELFWFFLDQEFVVLDSQALPFGTISFLVVVPVIHYRIVSALPYNYTDIEH